MATNWQKLHDAFFSNMNHAMYEWLGEQLGVPAIALRDLQVGWCPSVTWKSGKRGYGFFTSPQRDANGKIVGLALRDRDGGKCVYPGTGPGCVYPVNPKHRKGDLGYSAGAHNWVRTMDARELCPVCEKPDGCLLSAENPCDPRAVICLRHPSIKKMKFGWLHVRKREGDLSGESLLAGEGPVLVVEGMSDVAAAMGLGFTGIGRPSNLGGLAIVAELVRGRPMIVVGENDQKSDGKWPGRDGMMAAFETARKGTPDAKMIMPPPTVKDLRSWVVKNNLTTAEFTAYVAANNATKTDGVLISASPTDIARQQLKERYTI